MYTARFERFVVANGRNSLEQFCGKRPQSSGFRRIAPEYKLMSCATQVVAKPRLVLPSLDMSPRQMLCAAM